MSDYFMTEYRKLLGLNKHHMKIFLKYMAKQEEIKVSGLKEYMDKNVGTDPDKWDGLEINRYIGKYIKENEEKFTQALKI